MLLNLDMTLQLFTLMCKRPYPVDPLMRLRSGNYYFQ